MTFFRAFQLVRQKIPRLHALVIGGGELEETLIDFCRERGLEESIHFLGSRTDVHDWMRASDCIVQSSIIEGLPNVLMEAMLMKCPVVATDAGGTKEILLDGKTGLLVPTGDVEALASAVEKVLSDRELAKRLGENANRHMREHFDTAAVVEKLAGIYNRGISEAYGARAR